MIYLKKHRHSGIVALCDKGLIGRILKEGDFHLDLDAHRKFYVGEEKTPREAKEALKKGFSSINAVGEESVGVVLELELCEKEGVKRVEGVPHVQIYLIT